MTGDRGAGLRVRSALALALVVLVGACSSATSVTARSSGTTGVTSAKSSQHQHDTDRTLSGPTEVYPGTYGGIETPPATADGIAYVATLNSPTKLEPDEPSYFGSQLGTGKGEVVANNAANGRVVWDTTVPGDPLGGATVVNDLVFTALLDGTIVALRRDTGRIVWRFKADGGINGWLSATTDTLYVPVGQSKPPQILALRLPAS